MPLTQSPGCSMHTRVSNPNTDCTVCCRPQICSCSTCTCTSGTGATTTMSYPLSCTPESSASTCAPALWLLHICTHLRHRANITAGKLVPYILELLLLHECPCSRYQICPHSIGTHASDISVTTTVRHLQAKLSTKRDPLGQDIPQGRIKIRMSPAAFTTEDPNSTHGSCRHQ